MKKDEFYLHFSHMEDMKVDTIITNGKSPLRIIKVYKDNWFKRLVIRFAKWLLRNVRINQVKVTSWEGM